MLSHIKRLKNDMFSFAAWCSAFREVTENKRAKSLVSLCKALNGTPHLYVKDK